MIKTDYDLKDIDPDDISDLLVQVERSFGINFENAELSSTTTFGQLCDLVLEKIKLDDIDNCTTQQAFYKLRNAISASLQLFDQKLVSTNLLLTTVLPRKDRQNRTKKLENYLGFKLNILHPPDWLTIALTIVLVTSIVCLFLNFYIGLIALLFSFLGFWAAQKAGKELRLETVGQLAKKITRENYLKSRRNPKTFNKNEVVKLLIDLFSDHLALDKSKLTSDATFV